MTDKSNNRFAVKTVLLFSVLPQLFRIAADVIYYYEIAGNTAYGSWVEVAILALSDVFSKISFFSVLGTAIYLSAIKPLKPGASWSLLAIVICALSYVAMYTLESLYLVFLMLLLSAILTIFLVLYNRNGDRIVILLSLGTLIIPLFGGFATIYAAGVPTIDDIMAGVLYFAANLVFEVTLVLASAVMADLLCRRLKDREIGLEGKAFSVKNPIMLCMTVFSFLFALMTSVSPIIEGIEFAQDNASIMTANDWLLRVADPIIDVLTLFVIGYLIMRILSGVLERGTKESKGA